MRVFNGKYRADTVRLKSWDYTSCGYYFVTLCTLNHKCYFGSVNNSSVDLNCIGITADKFFQEIPGHIENTDIISHVVMPNHVHGIIFIKEESAKSINEKYFQGLKSPEKGSLGSIISQYKAAVKRFAVKSNIEFAWQGGYHEHIIRNEESLRKICEYISLNPLKWEVDEYNKNNICL